MFLSGPELAEIVRARTWWQHYRLVTDDAYWSVGLEMVPSLISG